MTKKEIKKACESMIEYLEQLPAETQIFGYGNGKRTDCYDAEAWIDHLEDIASDPCPEFFELEGVRIDPEKTAIDRFRKAFNAYAEGFDTAHNSPENQELADAFTDAREDVAQYIALPPEALHFVCTSGDLWDNPDWWIDEVEPSDPMRVIWEQAHAPACSEGDAETLKGQFIDLDTASPFFKSEIVRALTELLG